MTLKTSTGHAGCSIEKDGHDPCPLVVYKQFSRRCDNADVRGTIEQWLIDRMQEPGCFVPVLASSLWTDSQGSLSLLMTEFCHL